MNDPSLRLLRAFTVLAREGQFRKAAEKLHVSQSGFSQMISKLEKQLGARLVERDARRFRLTAEGALLLPMAEELQRRAASIWRTLQDQALHKKGKVAIASLPALMADWLPEVTGQFRAAHSAVSVRLFDVPQLERSWQMLREREVDFVLSPEAGPASEFDSTPLFEEGFHLVCPSGHRLARRKSLLLHEITGEQYIYLEPGGSVAPVLMPQLRKVGVRHSGFAMAFHDSIAGLVRHGLGVTVVPALSTLHYRLRGLPTIPLRDPELRRHCLVLKRRDEELGPAAAALLEFIAGRLPRGVARVAAAEGVD